MPKFVIGVTIAAIPNKAAENTSALAFNKFTSPLKSMERIMSTTDTLICRTRVVILSTMLRIVEGLIIAKRPIETIESATIL